MGTTVNFDTYILGGLQVHVKATMAPAEPDVGIFSSYIDDFEMSVYNKKGKLRPAWSVLYTKIGDYDMERLNEKAQEAMAGLRDREYERE